MGLRAILARDTDAYGVNAYCDEFEAWRQADSKRIDRMKTYRSETDMARNSDLMYQVGVPPAERDYGQNRRREHGRERHNIDLPLGKALNVKHAYRIAGELPDCVVDRRDDSPTERYRSDTMEKIVWSIMRVSRGATQFASGAMDGSELGASCFDLYYDVEKAIPVFRSVDPIGLIVVPGVEDPHDFQRVYRVWETPLASLQNEYKDNPNVRVGDITASHKNGATEMCHVVSMCDKTKRIVFLPDCGVKLEQQIHDFGFSPYVVIPNIGPERDIWGWADYEFVRAISHYIGLNLSREADILRAAANGSYIERGTGQVASVVKQVLHDGGVMPSKKEGTLEPIDVPQAPVFSEAHAARAIDLFKMLGFAPDASWGLGRYTSGANQGLSLQPFVEFTAMKQLNWESGLGRLFSMAYRMMESKHVGTGTYRGSKPAKYGNRRLPFVFQLGENAQPTAPPSSAPDDPSAGFDDQGLVELPKTPKDLFDGDYEVRFLWNNRINPDDPAYVLSELNKFQRGAQSLATTLERLGFEAPEDEMKRIEEEAERFPWLNQGMIAMIRAQLSAQGDGGGNPDSGTAANADTGAAALLASGQGGGGQLPVDAGQAALGGGGGQLYGGA